MKTKILLCLAVLCSLVRAEPVPLRLPGDAVALVNALSALDGIDRIVKAQGEEKAIRVPYDLGVDAVRIRLAIRRNLVALREAAEAWEQSRLSYMRELFGVDTLSADKYSAQPQALRGQFEERMRPLLQPQRIDLTLFTESDVATFAAAGVPGTISAALEPLVAKSKPEKK